MIRLRPRFFLLAAAGIAALPLSASAQTRPSELPHVGRVLECLSTLDVTMAQKVQIFGIFAGAWPEFQSNVAALETARQALRSAIDATPADACTIGSDYLAVKSAADTIRSQADSVRASLVGVLSPEQQDRIRECFDAAPAGDVLADEPAR